MVVPGICVCERTYTSCTSQYACMNAWIDAWVRSELKVFCFRGLFGCKQLRESFTASSASKCCGVSAALHEGIFKGACKLRIRAVSAQKGGCRDRFMFDTVS